MKMKSIQKRILGVLLLLGGVSCVVVLLLYFSDSGPGGLMIRLGTPFIVIALVGFLSFKYGLRLIKAESQETIGSGEDVHEGRPSIDIKTWLSRMDFWGLILILIGVVLMILLSWMAISNSNLPLLIIAITLVPLVTIVPGVLLLEKAKKSSQEITKGKDS